MGLHAPLGPSPETGALCAPVGAEKALADFAGVLLFTGCLSLESATGSTRGSASRNTDEKHEILDGSTLAQDQTQESPKPRNPKP